MNKKKRIPVIAAALSLVAPGLGQLYNGQILKGNIFFLAILLIPKKVRVRAIEEERCWI
jgi:TM2 domain-containing membrane protein YozV